MVNSKEYDQKNVIIKEANTTLNHSNPSDDKKQFVYNSKGELSKLIVKTPNNKFGVKFEYKYDDSNNWIEQSKYVNGRKLFIWKREIEYY